MFLNVFFFICFCDINDQFICNYDSSSYIFAKTYLSWIFSEVTQIGWKTTSRFAAIDWTCLRRSMCPVLDGFNYKYMEVMYPLINTLNTPLIILTHVSSWWPKYIFGKSDWLSNRLIDIRMGCYVQDSLSTMSIIFPCVVRSVET